MRPVKRSATAWPVCAGMVLAAIGFSYAIATSNNETASAREARMSARSVGSNLRIVNPFLLPGQDPQFPEGGDPNGFDLGDACFGSQIIRHISALGGVTAYRYSSTTIGSNSISPGLVLESSGRVIGAVPAGGPSPAKFSAMLTDAAGVTRSGVFTIGTTTCAPGDFRFAIDRLPLAQIGQDYITRIEALNADSNTTFSVLSNSIIFNAAPATNLEFFGLTLFKDGTLAGRPLIAGTLTFTVRATKGAQLALNRTSTAIDQSFTIAIGLQSTIQTALGTAFAALKGSAGTSFRNSFTLKAYVNTDGKTLSDFAGARFVFRIAGASFSTTLNAFGRAFTNDLSVKLVAPDGLLTVVLKNQDFAALLGLSNLQSGVTTAIVEVEIGDSVLGTEAIDLATKLRRDRYSGRYQIGKNFQVGGLFQVLAVRAADFSNGTAYRISALLSNVRGRTGIGFGVATGATVRIGPGFVETVSLRKGSGRFSPPGLQNVLIKGNRRTAVFTTHPLSSALTGVVPAVQSNGQTQTLLLGMDVDTTTTFFSGEGSKRIFPVIFR